MRIANRMALVGFMVAIVGLAVVATALCQGDAPEGEAIWDGPFDPETELSDEDVRRFENAPFDKAALMNQRLVLGRHQGLPLVAWFPCGDVCPDYTGKILHYDVELERCTELGGVLRSSWVPRGPALMEHQFCVPQILAESPEAP